MTPEYWRQIKLALDTILELPPERRQAYLVEVSAHDPELGREVEALLDSHGQSDGFLETPALVAIAAPEPRAGQRIGPYHIQEKIAQGGMGTVYKAIRADGHFEQQVALKLVKRGMDTDQVLRHFRNERQILAGLEHPNIARLLDGGATEDGRPYFVMEYIEGRPLDKYCDERKLSIAARLELFLVICSAVHYAHQRLVIHRDIKPGNILVTREGQPKLLDFGIAKLTASAPEATLTAAAMMTPEYASPEQLRGQPITTASDVYSLGLLLYRLLTGHPAHVRASVEEEPERPSVVAPKPLRCRLAGDLDSIVLKALRQEPEQRYSSVEQFAGDIQRHLDGVPVLARKGTARYRLVKFAKKNKAALVGAALVFITLAGGLAATAWEARVARAERVRAERRFNDVRKLANSLLFQFHDLIEDLPGSTPARSFLVKEALAYLDSLAAESHGDTQLQREVAAAYEKVGKVQGNPLFPNLGDTRGALASYRKSLEIRKAVADGAPANHQLQLELAAAHGQFGEMLLSTGDTGGGIAESGKALSIYEALAPEFSRDRTFQGAFATSAYNHANLLRRNGDLDGSLAKYRRGAELGKALIAANREDPAGWIHLAASLDGMGIVLIEKGDTAAALDDRRQALQIRERLAAADPNNAHYRRQLGFSHHNLALSLVEVGDLPGALKQFRDELSLFESLRAADPNDVQARRNLSLAHKAIGDVLVRIPDLNAALSHYDQALKIDQELSSKDPASVQALIDLSFSEGKFGFVLAKLGRTGDALAILRKGVKSQESLLVKDPHNDLLRGYLANSYTRLAQSLSQARDETALEYFRKALESRQALYAKSSNNTANRGALAECYSNLGQAIAPGHPAEALENYRRAIELLESLTAADSNNAQHRIHLSAALADAARIYARLEQWNQARALYKRSYDSWSQLERAGKLPAEHRRMPAVVARELAGLPNN
jgi:tetratricopeptide (TPR) repeat protein/predicted Ser/Thr protein kinase